MRPLIVVLPILLGGCSVARAVITAPIKAGEAIYDATTESREEADLKRGRAARKAEEQARREARAAEKARNAEGRRVQVGGPK